MSNILTPVTLWKNFDDSLEVVPVTLGEKVEDGIRYEYVNFSGRDTGMGRVTVYGVFAAKADSPSRNALLILPDSDRDIDENGLKYFVEKGYSVFMADYRGIWDGCERHTVYPDNVPYANAKFSARYKDFADESAEKTCWYEWVGVGVYARKYLVGKLNTPNVGVIGIRDGGEIVWKLISIAQFSCAVTVNACGWRAYRGYAKFGGEEPALDEERYRFIAGIDSQSYAPYVKCPVLMLCATNDAGFDYDRAYDTYARINPEVAQDSVIAYSVQSNYGVDGDCIKDMTMFLDRFAKQRHVFLPAPARISVFCDGEQNLVAKTDFDLNGIVEDFAVYYAEDCNLSALRDWVRAPYKEKISEHEHSFYLNVYEKTKTVFALCRVTYSNGFNVWSKICVKKLKGRFRNAQPKSKIMYTVDDGDCCFTFTDDFRALCGVFLTDESMLPSVTAKDKGLKGVYSDCGLTTYRLSSPRYAPASDSILKLDVCSDNDCTLAITMSLVASGEKFTARIAVVGGVWQSLLLKAKHFKNLKGAALPCFSSGMIMRISAKEEYAINNVMWL